MRLNVQQVVFNAVNYLKYSLEGVVDCLLISSWETLIHKYFIKHNDKLGKKLGWLEKDELKKEGILGGTLQPPKGWVNNYKTLEFTAELIKGNGLQ